MSLNIEQYKSYWGANILQQRLDKILDLCEDDYRLLDYGCGQGAYTNFLNKNNFNTLGTDIHYFEEWNENKSFIVIDNNNLPFESKYFDLTFCFEVLEHCENYHEILSELNRVTKKHIILSIPNCDINNSLRGANLVPAHWTDQTHVNFFTKESIRKILQDLNFEIISLEDCLPISVSEYYWKTLKAPNLIRKIGAKITRDFRLSPIFYSSILVHCIKK